MARSQGERQERMSAQSYSGTALYYIYFQSSLLLSWARTSKRREEAWRSSLLRAASSAALKRVSMYSLAKGVGNEMVRESDLKATGTVPSPNHTLRDEASMWPLACSSTRNQSFSASGSGVGGGGFSVPSGCCC